MHEEDEKRFLVTVIKVGPAHSTGQYVYNVALAKGLRIEKPGYNLQSPPLFLLIRELACLCGIK